MIEREIIEENPILKLGIKRKKEDAEPRPAEKESLKKILNLLDLNSYTEFRDYVFILLTLDTGIRPAEAVQVYENLFDYYNKDLRITPSIGKCNKSRILPLSDGVIKYVKRLLKLIREITSSLIIFFYLTLVKSYLQPLCKESLLGIVIF